LDKRYAKLIIKYQDGKWSAAQAIIIGTAYAVTGFIQVSISLGLFEPIIGFNDLVGGFLLIIVASVFYAGVRPLLKNEEEGYAFILVGYLLAAVLFFLQVLVILTNVLGWIMRFEDWLFWNIYKDITPSLWLFIILMIGTSLVWIVDNFRNKRTPKTVEVGSQ